MMNKFKRLIKRTNTQKGATDSGDTDWGMCPDCGGELKERFDGRPECQECHTVFTVDDDGSLYTEYYDPHDDYFDD